MNENNILKKLPKSILTRNQEKEFIKPHAEGFIKITLRYDDECGNGHNSFGITGEVNKNKNFTDNGFISGGCMHEEIIKHFPEFKHLVKWHLTSSDGPMYYLANTLYHASSRDCWGKLKGEPKEFKTNIFFDNVPIGFSQYSEKFCEYLQTHNDYNNYKIKEFTHESIDGYKCNNKYSFNDFADEWYKCPFNSKQEAEQFLEALQTCKVTFKKICVAWGDGKEPDLEAARHCAIWPEAKLEDITKENLLKRLPKLMKEFKKDMEAIGFVY